MEERGSKCVGPEISIFICNLYLPITKIWCSAEWKDSEQTCQNNGNFNRNHNSKFRLKQNMMRKIISFFYMFHRLM